MSESKLIKRFSKGGRRPKPAGFSFLTRQATHADRLRIIRYLSAVRDGLINDLGPSEDDLTTGQIVLIDRLVSLLGVCRAVEEHFQEDLMNNDGSLKPALKESYIAYNNTIRLTLQALGIDKQASEKVMSPLEFAKKIDQERERKAT